MKSEQVVELLASIGPCLSGTLSQAIQSTSGVSAVAARKQIERAKETFAIRSFGELQLKHGEQFLYLKEQSDTPAFRLAFFKALEDSKSAYGRALFGVIARGGIVPWSGFATVSGLPLTSDSGNLTATEALWKLIEWGMLWPEHTKGGYCVRLHPHISDRRVSDRRFVARLMVEDLVLAAIRDWFRLQGMTGTLASKRDDAEPPQFGYYQWDFVAPSYISVLRTGSPETKINPGFLVADVILGRILSVRDVKYFIEKSNAIRKRFRNRPFIPFLIAEWFDIEALNLGRKHGFTFTTVKNLFGRPFYKAITSMAQIVEDKALIDDKVEEFVDLVYSISHMSSALEEAKDTIFELIISSLLTREQYTFIEHHRIFNDFNNQLFCEADILVHTENTIKVAQCKAREESEDSIAQWFNVSVPVIHSVLARQQANQAKSDFEYTYYSTSALTDDIAGSIEKINAKNLGYRVNFLDKTTIGTLLTQLPGLRRLYRLITNELPNDDLEFSLSQQDDDD